MKLNEKILLLRKKAGLSQEELANELNISRQAVYKWESNASYPDVDNIKRIAKLFNVTFDYLMDDDIDEEKEDTQKGAEQYKHIYREVFDAKVSLAHNYADIDNGYSPDLKKVNKNSDAYFSARRAKASENLKSIGATEIIFLQSDAAVAFFYDGNKKVCGFYHTGSVQFVCPIENILSFSVNTDSPFFMNSQASAVGIGVGHVNSIGIGSMPTTTVINSKSAQVTLCYLDEKNSPVTFDIRFAVGGMHTLSTKPKSLEEIEIIDHALMVSLMNNLNTVKTKIDGLKVVGERILTGKVQVPALDMSFYRSNNEKMNKSHRAYMEDIAEEAHKIRNADFIKKLVIVGLVAAVVIGFILIVRSCTA